MSQRPPFIPSMENGAWRRILSKTLKGVEFSRVNAPERAAILLAHPRSRALVQQICPARVTVICRDAKEVRIQARRDVGTNPVGLSFTVADNEAAPFLEALGR